MANRYVPFGYEVIDGVTCIVEREAEVVRNVYALYIQGLSLIKIAGRLNMLSITYASDGREWDKHMVKRMLENPKYIGEKGYPAIITEDIAKLVVECKSKKYIQLSDEDKQRLDAYRAKMRCGVCGSRMVRLHAGSGTIRRYWKCSNEECVVHRQNFNEKILNSLMADLLNEISEDLTMIETEIVKDYEKNSAVLQAHSELAEKIENPESELEDIITKIMDLAAVKFQLCKEGDNTAVTEKIKEDMAVYAEKTEADGRIIGKIVHKIRIYPNRELVVELINGKELKRNVNAVVQ